MIREHRSREKLQGYYAKFVDDGVMDPNVHPWVADSWQKSRALGVPSDKMYTGNHVTPEELAKLQHKHQMAVD